MRSSTTRILSSVALVVVGIVSYLVLAADIVCSSGSCNGTPGNDRILIPKTGVEIVNAQGGNDRVTVASNISPPIKINGGDGNDIIFDAAGASTLNGDAGNDIIHGNGANDIINGGAGNDRIFGGEGNDTINSGAGNDHIFGGQGNDIIDGGPGNDIIDPGPGQDGTAAPTSFTNPANTTTGGGGNDIFILRRGESGGTEYILCTTGNPSDRGLVKLIGYSRDDPALPLQQLNRPLTDTNPTSTPTTYTEIPDGANKFLIYHGRGRCKIIVSSQ